MEWAEDLPGECPPQDAVVPDNEVFFRAVQTIPPTENDFYSPKKLQPDRQLDNECTSRALSVFNTIEGCQQLKKHVYFRNHLIVSITLQEECGLVKWTPSALSRNHYDWWLSSNFNPISECVTVGKVS